jgi:hypothetical protein
MSRIFALYAVLVLGASAAWAQNKILSTTPSASNLPVKQLEVNIEFLAQEMDRMLRLVKEMETKVNKMDSCQDAGKIYAPGAAGVGLDSDGADAGTDTDGCVVLTGVPVVTEIKATTASINGNMGAYGANATARMQGFMNSNGCATSEGWRPCSDDEVIYALDQQVGGLVPTTIIDGSTYWVRSLLPFRFSQTDTSTTATSLNCSGWTSSSAPFASPAELVGTMFSGSTTLPMFNFGSCAVARKILCCR